MRNVVLLSALGACGQPPQPAHPTSADRIAIIAAEGSKSGVHLISLDEHGDRQFELLEPAENLARDVNPVVSPDCRWIAFASSRGRAFDETSLWIAKLGAEAAPVRLTSGPGIDAFPAWAPDGRSIVFSSTRAHACTASTADRCDFDLYRLAIVDGKSTGEPERLTSEPTYDITPAVAPDGRIAYAAVSRGSAGIESHLVVRATDGSLSQLTSGPGDSAPRIAPDGAIVFTRPHANATGVDGDVWRLPSSGGEPELLVGVPMTEEGGAAWSRDGRFLFLTSRLLGADKTALFESVIHVDLTEQPRVPRMLEDRTGPMPRLTPAVGCVSLDAKVLRANPPYGPELARIIGEAIAKQQAEQARDATPPQ